MNDTHPEDEYPNTEEYQGQALIDLGFREGELSNLTVIRPSGLAVMDLDTIVVTVEVRKPPVEGLPTTMDVQVITKATGDTTQVADGYTIDPIDSMPDVAVIRKAMALIVEHAESEGARLKARSKALKLLEWLTAGGVSHELLDLIDDDRVTVSCKLDGTEVIYGLEIWAGSKPSLSPSDLFADE